MRRKKQVRMQGLQGLQEQEQQVQRRRSMEEQEH
jgi:hypothetical protein